MTDKEGLLIIEIEGKMYCGNCGMPILNKTEWKKIHLDWHKHHDRHN